MMVKDVLCPFCGALCDDLSVNIENGKITEVRDACDIGESKIKGHERIRKPSIDGKECSYDDAIKKAAEILKNSKRPLMYGFSSTVCEAHKVGVEIAEEIGAVIDNTASVCHGPSVLAIQNVGLPSCTLGQIKNRADLVIYWGSNQSQAHPRHMSRYASFPKGFFVADGRKNRKVVVIDVRRTTTANVADEFIQVNPGEDYAILSALRAILAGSKDAIPNTVGGVPKEKLVELAEKMKAAKFGIIFFGMGLTHSRGRYANISNAISLTRELNAFTKFAIMPMRGHYNVAGFNQVCAWETGFPFAVDLSRGRPWYNPGETAAVDILNREECDSALIIASDPGAHFPHKSVQHLARIPVIQIDPYANPTTLFAKVIIPSAIAGIEAEGTAYRMDSVPLRMRKIIEPNGFLTDEEILKKILVEIRRG
jgi:formylmethanofuran dehydrogenase subunit B